MKTSSKLQARMTQLYKTFGAPIEMTAKGGFPVFVWLHIGKAEPDVGYMSAYIYDSQITTRACGEVGFLKISDTEKEDLVNDAYANVVSNTYSEF